MSTTPADLAELAAYWRDQGGTPLGVVGDQGRHCKGYHLGRDRIYGVCACRPDGDCVAGLGDNDYSVRTPRDRGGLTNDASAIDLGALDGSYVGLRAFSQWLVTRARANAPGTADFREIIYSPDGMAVLRWDRERGYASLPRSGEADNTHRTHTHISFYRDSRTRSKVPVFEPYFEGEEMPYAYKAERWILDGNPDAKVTTLGAPQLATGAIDWQRRLALVSDTGGANPRLVEIARSRLTPVSEALSDEFYDTLTAYSFDPVTAAAILSGRRFEWDRQFTANAAKITPAARP